MDVLLLTLQSANTDTLHTRKRNGDLLTARRSSSLFAAFGRTAWKSQRKKTVCDLRTRTGNEQRTRESHSYRTTWLFIRAMCFSLSWCFEKSTEIQRCDQRSCSLITHCVCVIRRYICFDLTFDLNLSFYFPSLFTDCLSKAHFSSRLQGEQRRARKGWIVKNEFYVDVTTKEWKAKTWFQTKYLQSCFSYQQMLAHYDAKRAKRAWWACKHYITEPVCATSTTIRPTQPS